MNPDCLAKRIPPGSDKKLVTNKFRQLFINRVISAFIYKRLGRKNR